MKQLFLIILLFFVGSSLYSQENRIEYNPDKDDNDLAAFMNMMGFDYHKFEMKSKQPAFINVYVDEYLNDKLINHFDHIAANKDSIPKDYFNLVFTKLNAKLFTLKVYTLSKNDSIEQVQFRIGELGLFRKLRVNRKTFDYSWKLTEFTNNIGPKIELNKKIPILYYATALQQNIDESTVNAFCSIPNILNNRNLIENQGKIKHFFEIGIELVEKIE
ncbi:hypothetical protein [Winogradskyella alexanderae]|jgi:hypothetical protein|uniref:GLPGLI family protein n=1 Tax=Winogradskyella alexanderae TaxID=2877123 RepID=A0ABS7XU21_9FLAO|nr:hypothetical protein [Winogradskyella alexanderae]MCA0133525.1 hypothetical protein [Winogradskyella alexanderae]